MRPLRPFLKGGGGHIVPPLSFEGCWGAVVSKSSNDLTPYSDWYQTKGFTTFRYLEPPKLMVWKSDFFRWSLTLVRVPPYESGVKMTNFQFSWLNGEFLWGQKCSPHFLNQNEELSKKIGACICIYTRVYANTWQVGLIEPYPALNRVKRLKCHQKEQVHRQLHTDLHISTQIYRLELDTGLARVGIICAP